MPELDVPRGAAVIHDGLDHKWYVMPFLVAAVHPSGLTLAIDHLGDGGGHHCLGFPSRRDEVLGRQMLFFQVQQVAYLLLKSFPRHHGATPTPTTTDRNIGRRQGNQCL